MVKEIEKDDCYKKIEALLSNYVDGFDVFNNAENWEASVALKEEAKSNKQLPTDLMELLDKVISIVAHDRHNLDTYDNIIKMIRAKDMISAYASVGMPVGYSHWSFGKNLIATENAYNKGAMGLAYEIVINTNPVISYCMEDNSIAMQALVVAHACYGHNSFFKGNYLFRQFTNPDDIEQDLLSLNSLIQNCEKAFGKKRVERVQDACHALMNYGVDRRTRSKPQDFKEKIRRLQEREEARRLNVNLELDEVTFSSADDFNEASNDNNKGPIDGDENILLYVANNSQNLEPWEADIAKGIAGLAQYFYPQKQTQVMNEGWASFWHYTLLTDLNDMGIIGTGMMLEILPSHTNVIYQPDFDSPEYSGFNPYALGFAVFSDIKRICMEPTEEDYQWFPAFAGNDDWRSTLEKAMREFRDESFLDNYLSPKVIRDFRLFNIIDDDKEVTLEVAAVSNKNGYDKIIDEMAAQYRLSDREPCIEVVNHDVLGDRSLVLQHTIFNGMPLDKEDTEEVLKHLYALHRQPIILNSIDINGKIIDTMTCPKDYDPDLVAKSQYKERAKQHYPY